MRSIRIESIRTTAPYLGHDVLQSVVQLALEIACEGRDTAGAGALFTVGHAESVLACSRPLILDPLSGHTPVATHITDPRLRGTIKELARLDGAFVVDDDGTVAAACRYLDAPAKDVDVPLGLGSRHVAAASISRQLGVLAIAVSETGVVRIFSGGDIAAEIRPQDLH